MLAKQPPQKPQDKPATKRVVAKPVAAKPVKSAAPVMPSIVDNPTLNRVSTLLAFTASKAHAVVNKSTNEESKEIVTVLSYIENLSIEGVSVLRAEVLAPSTVEFLERYGYKVTREEPATSWFKKLLPDYPKPVGYWRVQW